MKIRALSISLSALLIGAASLAMAQEYDDMYFSRADRKVPKKVTMVTAPEQLSSPTFGEQQPVSGGKFTNPDFSNTSTSTNNQSNSDAQEAAYYQESLLGQQYDDRFSNASNGYYSPYDRSGWGNSNWRPRPYLNMGFGSWGSWMNVGLAFGTPSWGYSPFYDPFWGSSSFGYGYSPWGYSAWGNPYRCSPFGWNNWYSPAVVINNNYGGEAAQNRYYTRTPVTRFTQNNGYSRNYTQVRKYPSRLQRSEMPSQTDTRSRYNYADSNNSRQYTNRNYGNSTNTNSNTNKSRTFQRSNSNSTQRNNSFGNTRSTPTRSFSTPSRSTTTNRRGN
jgi:hypothetical protein